MKIINRSFPVLRKLWLIAGMMFLSASPAVFADSAATIPDEFIWNFATLALLENANKDNGEKLAEAQKCSKCHGDTGISDEDDTPSIAGQLPSYLYKQLMNYKQKIRSERSMTKAAKKLSPQEMADISVWYASQTGEPSVAGGENPPALTTMGDKDRLLLACDQCHGAGGKGYGYESPVLSGQKGTYLVDTMLEFKEGDRENDDHGRMRFIASQLSEAEIDALASFYAAKPTEE